MYLQGKNVVLSPLHWATFPLRDGFKNLPGTPFSPESALDSSKHRRSSPWGLLMNKGKISVGLEGFLEKGSLYPSRCQFLKFLHLKYYTGLLFRLPTKSKGGKTLKGKNSRPSFLIHLRIIKVYTDVTTIQPSG